jgi:hypothetical protein
MHAERSWLIEKLATWNDQAAEFEADTYHANAPFVTMYKR